MTGTAASTSSLPTHRASRGGERALLIHAGVSLAVAVALTVIWAATWRGYFWPQWTWWALATPVLVHAAVRLALRAPPTPVRPLVIQASVSGSIIVAEVWLWALAGAGYFWPVWTLLWLALPVAVHALVVLSRRRDPDEELAERVDVLTRTRAGAVDAQAAELQRIERDLHDGAQARLVSVAINLGLAEEKLDDEPEKARALVASARSEARQALTELRDLARGIYPPVLQDRGLEAAVKALVVQSPIPVTTTVELGSRLPAPVESAAYFVVAEALANTAKHASACCASILITSRDGVLSLTIGDDGAGGADPEGLGLSGLRKRVQALDGTLALDSPKGGPTILHVELPCGS